MKKTLAFVIVFSLWLAGGPGCGNDKVDAGNAATGWSGVVAGSPAEFNFSTVEATLRADGGTKIVMSGTSNLGAASFTLELSGAVNVEIVDPGDGTEPKAEVPVNFTDVNTTLSVDGANYRGTSGTITFTAYDATPGGIIAGSVDIGLVKLGGVTGDSATLSGSVTAELPSEEAESETQ